MDYAALGPAEALGSADTNNGRHAQLSRAGTTTTFAPDPAHAPDADEDVSVAGVLVLSAMSMLMAVLGMVTFALAVTACWWLISHIPVPAGVHTILAHLHLVRR